MKTVEIVIKNNTNDHHFIINGDTIYEGDAIANYVHKPFSAWRDEIIPELYENCNDDFCIKLISGEEEYEYLRNLSEQYAYVKDIDWEPIDGGDEEEEKEPELSYENIGMFFPESIDLGDTVPVHILGISSEEVDKLLNFEFSDPSIISYENGMFTGQKAGTVEVRLKYKGKIEFIQRGFIEVIAHKTVQQILLEQTYYHGEVGDRIHVIPHFIPEDAEDIGLVQFRSFDPKIVTCYEDGSVDMLSMGRTKIEISRGEVKAYVTIDVEPELKSISFSLPSVEVVQGQETPFYITVDPETYNLEFLEISVDNPDVIAYQGRSVIGKAVGITKIHVTSKKGDVSASAYAEVISIEKELGRRAINVNNFADASMHFEQLRSMQPNDWEALFFSAYSRIFLMQGLAIKDAVALLTDRLNPIARAILDMPQEDRRMEALQVYFDYIIMVAHTNAKRIIPLVQQARRGQDHLNCRNICVIVRHACATLAYHASMIADVMNENYPGKFLSYRINLLKAGVVIDIQTLQYSSGNDTKIILSDIDDGVKMIRQFEPNYAPPAPEHTDSPALDYISFFI